MTATWRRMTKSDIADVVIIAAEVHPDYPEDAEVFSERLRLYPEGCFVLAGEGGVCGYVLSHPWRDRAVPTLNTLLGTLPQHATTFYLHDIALLPEARGGGFAAAIVKILAAHAHQNGFPTLSLCAVNGSAPFWGNLGFRAVEDPALAGKLKTYDADARFMTRGLVFGADAG